MIDWRSMIAISEVQRVWAVESAGKRGAEGRDLGTKSRKGAMKHSLRAGLAVTDRAFAAQVGMFLRRPKVLGSCE